MSKSKPKPASPSTGGQSSTTVRRPWLSRYAVPTLVAVLCLPLCFIGLFKLSLMVFGGIAAKLGILYLFGFDGKVSGRMDGNVLMRNGRGRGFVVPALVQNAYTAAIRSTFSNYSQGFRALTAGQILAWSAFTMTAVNRFGKSIQISGKECYVRLNQNLEDIGASAITDPPVLAGTTNVALASAAMAAGAGTATITFSGHVASCRYIVFATSAQSPGVSRPSASKFRIITTFTSAAVSPLSVSAAYITKYGAIPAAGAKVFFKVVAVNSTTGEKSASSAVVSAVVAP